MVFLLRSKSHPAESSWVSTTACKTPKTLSREERGVGGLLGNPEPPSRRERQQVVLSWYVTGKPFPPPQNTDSPERGWKVPCFRSNQHFRARCCTHSTRFATQGCSSPSCSALGGGGSCPVGCLRPGGRAGPQPGTGGHDALLMPGGLLPSSSSPAAKEPKALKQRWVAPRRGAVMPAWHLPAAFAVPPPARDQDLRRLPARATSGDGHHHRHNSSLRRCWGPRRLSPHRRLRPWRLRLLPIRLGLAEPRVRGHRGDQRAPKPTGSPRSLRDLRGARSTEGRAPWLIPTPRHGWQPPLPFLPCA